MKQELKSKDCTYSKDEYPVTDYTRIQNLLAGFGNTQLGLLKWYLLDIYKLYFPEISENAISYSNIEIIDITEYRLSFRYTSGDIKLFYKNSDRIIEIESEFYQCIGAAESSFSWWMLELNVKLERLYHKAGHLKAEQETMKNLRSSTQQNTTQTKQQSEIDQKIWDGKNDLLRLQIESVRSDIKQLEDFIKKVKVDVGY